MNESFKNSLKGFKVKGILIAFAAFVIRVDRNVHLRLKEGFIIVALGWLVIYVIKAIIDNKKAIEAEVEAGRQAAIRRNEAAQNEAAQKRKIEALMNERDIAQKKAAELESELKELKAKMALESEAPVEAKAETKSAAKTSTKNNSKKK